MKSPEETGVKIIMWIAFLVLAVFIVVMITQPTEQSNQPTTPETSNSIATVLATAPRQGVDNADVLIIEFGDFECPFCKQFSPTIKQALKKYPDKIMLVWVHTPNSQIHPQANLSAMASQCAWQQDKFWEFHDALFAKQDELSPSLYNQVARSLNLNMTAFQTCLSNQDTLNIIEKHKQFALDQDIAQTPTISVNGRIASGVLTFEDLDKLIQEEL